MKDNKIEKLAAQLEDERSRENMGVGKNPISDLLRTMLTDIVFLSGQLARMEHLQDEYKIDDLRKRYGLKR